METVDPKTLWFDTPDSHTLCRAGGNGPEHPSQLYAIKKYVRPGMTFLDYGAGSATTLEALINLSNGESLDYEYNTEWIKDCYLGVDVIKKNTEWCQKNFKDYSFEYNPTLHKIDQPDKSWDVVYSRHVIDHMKSFEDALDEHKRVAKKLVIVVLWVPFSTQDEHEIKHIVDQGKVYEDEYTNSYSEKKVMDYLLGDSEWQLREVTPDVGSEVKGHDTVIVLERK